MTDQAPITVAAVSFIDIRRVFEPSPDTPDALPEFVLAKVHLDIGDPLFGPAEDTARESFTVRLPARAAAWPLARCERLALQLLADRLRSIAAQLPAAAERLPDAPKD